MLVCSSCRAENVEDAPVCRHCGSSLEAIGSPLRRIDRSEEEEVSLDLPPPRATSLWPLVITLLVAGFGVLGWGLFAALQPNPCAGKFTSSLYSYCADIPQGWVGGLRPAGDTYEDRFEPTALDGEAQATVRVSSLLASVATPQYAQQYRTSQEATGFELSEVDPVLLDGEEALAWNYSITPDGEESPLRVREVILVRGGAAWRIRLVATDEAYENARFEFEDLLASWRWKG